MGGPPPLGYTNQNKKLVIVPDEAEAVRWIYQRYLELKAIGPLLAELQKAGIKTKARTYGGEHMHGGGRFGRGALSHLLKNRCYIGELVHQGQIYAAEHEPILERSMFDAVQSLLAANCIDRRSKVQSSVSLLAGLIFDSAGNRMSPHYTRKKGVLYRYYTSQAVLQTQKGKAGEVTRVAAPDVERLVSELVAGRAGVKPVDRAVLEAYIVRVTLLASAVQVALRAPPEPGMHGAGRDECPETVSLPWSPKPFVAEKGIFSPGVAPAGNKSTDTLLTAIAKARFWVDEIMSGASIIDIANREGKGSRQIRLLMPLAFVSPDVVRRLIDGDIEGKTVTELANAVPIIW